MHHERLRHACAITSINNEICEVSQTAPEDPQFLQQPEE
jgi:hypothetical protein